jgi:5-methylcytosine-specific restriction endonuclease McrA
MKAKRKEALLVNETYYFTGKPCKKGHVAPRRTINGFCTACEKDKNNSEARKQYMVDYAEKNREKIRQIANNWQKNNKGKVNANTAIRHSRKMQRRPSWLTKEDKEYIRCLYQLSAMLNRETNTQWHVDHIVPLQGEMVNGLHVPWNLRVIPAKENMVKGNKYNG